MAPFAGDAVVAVQHRAVHHDAAAHAGAEDRAEHHRGARGGAVDRLRKRKAVGVVREAHFAVEAAFEVVLEAPAVEGRVVGVDHAAAARMNRARHADAHPAAPAGFFLGVEDHAGEFLQRDVVPGARGGRALPHDLAAAIVEYRDLDLGAA